MEYSSSQTPMDHSVYNDALHQLHQSNQVLQEVTQNMRKEQSRMGEMFARIQVDLEAYKESQNDRIDEMMQNMDSDVKKVYNYLGKDYEKLNNQILEIRDEYVEAKDYKELNDNFQELKRLVTINDTAINRTENDLFVDVIKDLTSFKTEIEQKVENNLVDLDAIQEYCVHKLDEYVKTEILEEIVSTINLKLSSVKAEFQGEFEQTRIQIDDLNLVFFNLKNKIDDLEISKRGFNESDLYTCSIDETRTPIKHGSLRMENNRETPCLDFSCSHETRSRSFRNLDSTPNGLTVPFKPPKFTLNDLMDANDKEEESIQFVFNKKEFTSGDTTITKLATDVEDTKALLGTLAKEFRIYQSKLASLEEILTSPSLQSHQDDDNNDTAEDFSFQSVTTEGNQTIRQESWVSSFMVNLAEKLALATILWLVLYILCVTVAVIL
eukprot:GFUD01011040.1.p1 GENE.GFUD01011040.1~~GFUD01011040.1.p1  ORF type:complete len:438 (+),score=102.33 GFUD01011040.1:88-1401(+)